MQILLKSSLSSETTYGKPIYLEASILAGEPDHGQGSAQYSTLDLEKLVVDVAVKYANDPKLEGSGGFKFHFYSSLDPWLALWLSVPHPSQCLIHTEYKRLLSVADEELSLWVEMTDICIPVLHSNHAISYVCGGEETISEHDNWQH